MSFISPEKQTYWPAHATRSPDILDFYITSIPNGINKHITNLDDLSSDHSPLLLTLGGPIINIPNSFLSSGTVNWKLFQNKLDESISLNFPLKCPIDVDIAVTTLTKSIQNAVSNSSYPTNKDQPKSYTSLPPFLVNLIKAKRRARSLWQRTKYPRHKTIFNHLVYDLKTQLAKTDLTNTIHT